jgi:nicotinamide phosphoribosyltransferase
VNSKGYKVLNNVRMIQGDGINEFSIQEILDNLLNAGFSATNIAFGMGGQLLQGLNRDTLKFAMKCSHIFIGDESVDVFKDPVTDHGKRSKAGRLDLIQMEDGSYQTVLLGNERISCEDSIMQTVYEDGELLVSDNFASIRERAK